MDVKDRVWRSRRSLAVERIRLNAMSRHQQAVNDVAVFFRCAVWNPAGIEGIVKFDASVNTESLDSPCIGCRER